MRRREFMGFVLGAAAAAPIPSAGVRDDAQPPAVSGDMARVNGAIYSTLAAALDAATPRGVVEILPGTHLGPAVAASWNKPVTIRGVIDPQGRRPFLDLDGATVQKAILNFSADLVLEDIGLRQATTGNQDANAAGARPERSCQSMICRRVIFTDNETAVLTPTNSQSARYLFENCLIASNGFPDRAHNIYIGRAGEVRLVRSILRDATGGHELKSRANRTIIEDCTILNSGGGRAIDIPDGGYFHVSRSVVRKLPRAAMTEMIGFHREGQFASQGRTHHCLIEKSILDCRRIGGVVLWNDARSGVTAMIRDCTIPGVRTMRGAVTVL